MRQNSIKRGVFHFDNRWKGFHFLAYLLLWIRDGQLVGATSLTGFLGDGGSDTANDIENTRQTFKVKGNPDVL